LKHHNSLKPLNGLDFEKEDVCKVIFSHKKTVKACRLFMEWLKTVGGECTRSELSQFARDLANGRVQDGFTYKRSNFYRTILRRFVALGFISLQPRWEECRYVHKYARIYQLIPKRAPLGDPSFWRLAWEVAKKWNEECER
jgi:hypothetical protein